MENGSRKVENGNRKREVAWHLSATVPTSLFIFKMFFRSLINRDERGFPLTQYITNGGISSDRNTFMHFKHHHRVLRLISNRMSV